MKKLALLTIVAFVFILTSCNKEKNPIVVNECSVNTLDNATLTGDIFAKSGKNYFLLTDGSAVELTPTKPKEWKVISNFDAEGGVKKTAEMVSEDGKLLRFSEVSKDTEFQYNIKLVKKIDVKAPEVKKVEAVNAPVKTEALKANTEVQAVRVKN